MVDSGEDGGKTVGRRSNSIGRRWEDGGKTVHFNGKTVDFNRKTVGTKECSSDLELEKCFFIRSFFSECFFIFDIIPKVVNVKIHKQLLNIC